MLVACAFFGIVFPGINSQKFHIKRRHRDVYGFSYASSECFPKSFLYRVICVNGGAAGDSPNDPGSSGTDFQNVSNSGALMWFFNDVCGDLALVLVPVLVALILSLAVYSWDLYLLNFTKCDEHSRVEPVALCKLFLLSGFSSCSPRLSL